jgi:hypothetical protein
MRLSSNSENADARNNIFFVTAAGNRLAMLDDTGPSTAPTAVRTRPVVRGVPPRGR